MALVSVVIPTFNAEKFVGTAIESCLAQTLHDIEVICVNDGSVDGSLRVLQEFAGADSRVRVLSQANTGIGGARNAGIRESSGEWVFFLDADDWLSQETLEKAVAVGVQTDADAVVPDLCFVVPPQMTRGRTIVGCADDRSVVLSGNEALLKSLAWEMSGFALWHRRVIAGHRYDETRKGYTDEVGTRQLLFKSRRVAFSAGEYCYLQNPGSITNRFSLRSFDKLAADQMLSMLLETAPVAPAVRERHAVAAFRGLWGIAVALCLRGSQLSASDRRQAEIELESAYARLDRRSLRRSLLGRRSLKLAVQAIVLLNGFPEFMVAARTYSRARSGVRRVFSRYA